MSTRPHEKLLLPEQPAPPSLGGSGASIRERRAIFNQLSRRLLGLDDGQPASFDVEPGITSEWIEAQRKELSVPNGSDSNIARVAARMYLFVAGREIEALNRANDLDCDRIHTATTTIARHLRLAKGSEKAPSPDEEHWIVITSMTHAMWRSVHNGLGQLDRNGKSLGEEKIIELKDRIGKNLDALWNGNPSADAIMYLVECQDRLQKPLKDGPGSPLARLTLVKTKEAKSVADFTMPLVFAAGGMRM